MKQVNYSIEECKLDQFDTIADDMGHSRSSLNRAVVTAFLKKTQREQMLMLNALK